jgi:hypothetical protein
MRIFCNTSAWASYRVDIFPYNQKIMKAIDGGNEKVVGMHTRIDRREDLQE